MKKISLLSLFWRSFFIQALWNFEGLQNAGFLFVVFPALKKLYADKEKRKEALLRHIEYFNTQPYMASMIVGLVARMEEEKSQNGQVSAEDISTVKRNMAGPLAAMGDTLFWGTFRPLVAILTAGLMLLSFKVNFKFSLILLPFLFVAVYNLVKLPFRYWGILISYKMGGKIISRVASINFQKIVNFLRLLTGLALVAIIIFYFAFYAPNAVWTVVFILTLLLTVVWSCFRWPIVALFYLVIVAGIFISKLFNS